MFIDLCVVYLRDYVCSFRGNKPLHIHKNEELTEIGSFFFSSEAISTRMELDLVSESIREFESREGVHFGDNASNTFNQLINEVMREIICVSACSFNQE